MDKKKEYQRRVSPIVRIGGRSKLNHKPMINAMNTADPKPETPMAQFLFNRKASQAPMNQQAPAHKAYGKKALQLIPYPPSFFR